MYSGNTVSLKQILWKVMNHPLASELSYDLAAEYALEAINLIGAPLAYVSKVSDPIAISSYKGALPTDMVELIQARAMVNADDAEINTIPMTYATDSFHADLACRDGSNHLHGFGSEITYVTEQGIIKTSFDEGYVQISYKALPTCDDGFPLIPDVQKVKLALEYYILSRYLAPLNDVGKITDKAFNRVDTNRHWYMAAASSEMKIANPDHVEAIMNTINRLIVNTSAHDNFYKFMGKREQIKNFN